MKKSLVLAVLMVLALSVSAFAATTVTNSGYVKYGFDKVGDKDPVWWSGYRINFNGKVNDTTGFVVRFQGDRADDKSTTSDFQLKRYNLYTTTAIGKFVVGGQWDDLGGLNWYYGDGADYMATSTKLGFYPVINDATKVFVSYDPVGKVVAGSGKYTAGALSVWGGASKKDSDSDAKLAVGAKYAVIADTFDVYGQYNVQGSNDEEIVGAKYVLAGINCVGEYKVRAKELALDFSKDFQGITLDFNYVKPDSGDATLELGAELDF